MDAIEGFGRRPRCCRFASEASDSATSHRPGSYEETTTQEGAPVDPATFRSLVHEANSTEVIPFSLVASEAPRSPPRLATCRERSARVRVAIRPSIPSRRAVTCNDCGVACRSHVTNGLTYGADLAHRQRRVGTSCTALTALALLVSGGLALVAPSASSAATSGWSVSTVPGSGEDDVLLGTACTSGTQCFAVGVTLGDLSSPTTVPTPIIDSWNGTSWNYSTGAPLPAGVEGGLFNITCASPVDCWAVGTQLEAGGNGNSTGALVENWNGTAWSVVPTPTPSGNGVVGAFLQGVTCTSPSDCIAVGYTTDINGGNLNDLIEQWKGSSWTIVPGGDTGQTYDELMRVDCLSADNCWAVGNAGPAQQDPNFLPIYPGAVGDQGLIEHWDGSSWTVVPSTTEPSPGGGFLYGIECLSASDCWASGAVTDDTGQGSGLLMEQWNGSVWTDISNTVPVPSGTSGGAILSSISCVGPSACWAVGSYGSFGGGGGSGFRPQAFIEYWNGSSWSIEPSPRGRSDRSPELGVVHWRRGVHRSGHHCHRRQRERSGTALLRGADDLSTGIEPGLPPGRP